MSNQSLLERKYTGRRAELKRVILNEALACFLEHGIEMTTIDMIRERADTSVGAIYHHFKNKEGIVATLYVMAIDDQAECRDRDLAKAGSVEQGIQCIIESYIAWVVDYPDFARFLYAANFSIAKSIEHDELKQRNALRNQHLLAWMKQQSDYAMIQNIPHELLLSLVVGSTESYCRAWLSHKVKSSPHLYKKQLAESAWNCLEKLGNI